jgi:hypothetical protein
MDDIRLKGGNGLLNNEFKDRHEVLIAIIDYQKLQGIQAYLGFHFILNDLLYFLFGVFID